MARKPESNTRWKVTLANYFWLNAQSTFGSNVQSLRLVEVPCRLLEVFSKEEVMRKSSKQHKRNIGSKTTSVTLSRRSVVAHLFTVFRIWKQVVKSFLKTSAPSKKDAP